jgi:hypothetical protein
MELAITVRLVNLGSEDKGCFRREDLVVEVRQALGCKSAESPCLVHQLSMFYHR